MLGSGGLECGSGDRGGSMSTRIGGLPEARIKMMTWRMCSDACGWFRVCQGK